MAKLTIACRRCGGELKETAHGRLRCTAVRRTLDGESKPCGHSEPLPVAIVLRRLGAMELPLFESEGCDWTMEDGENA